jgi:hypothetical protein
MIENFTMINNKSLTSDLDPHQAEIDPASLYFTKVITMNKGNDVYAIIVEAVPIIASI